ncbi:MAG: hypothetical protein E5V75_06310 [Mesorhizobium sp.]|nr:MAG: hypothetical protein E5V75_06310 [Mesorhizobium sp.]
MTISLTQVMSAISKAVVPKYWVGYFRESFRGEINDQLLESFRFSGLTKADIARKLDRRPEQITRWLSAPCNLEADTISDIALALGLVPKIRFEKVDRDQSNNRVHNFVAEYDKYTVEANTDAQKFVYVQSTYDTSLPRRSASTARRATTVFMQATDKAYVTKVPADA